MSFFKKQTAFLGVDVGANGMKLVELRQFKGRPQLWTYGLLDQPMSVHDLSNTPPTETLPEKTEKKKGLPNLLTADEEARAKQYGELLQELCKAARISSHVATASLPVSSVFHALLTLPHMSKQEELDRVVNAEVTKMLPHPIDEMQVAYQKVPDGKNDKYIRTLVTAAPKRLVAFYTALFAHAGLTLKELETEAFALERSLVGRDTATVMIVDIGAERTNFFIMDEGLPMTHRSIQLGGKELDTRISRILGTDPAYADQLKKDLSLIPSNKLPKELFTDFIDEIYKEIQYGFELFLHQSIHESKRPEKIILTGGVSQFKLLTSELKQRTQMNVFVGDPWARVVYQQELKPVLDTLASRMSVCIGLALRNMV